MAELAIVEGSESPEPPPRKKARQPAAIGIVAGAVAAGLCLGALVLAPAFAPRSAADGGADTNAKGKERHKAEPASVVELDNIIVNPAGSEGNHYLLATVAIEVMDKETEEYVRTHEHVVKDVVISTLSEQTMEMLQKPGARDALKVVLAGKIGDLIGDSAHLQVYLPQFVVQ